jgi:hypothetical protein
MAPHNATNGTARQVGASTFESERVKSGERNSGEVRQGGEDHVAGRQPEEKNGTPNKTRRHLKIPNRRAHDEAESSRFPAPARAGNSLPVQVSEAPAPCLSRHSLMHTTTSMKEVTGLLPRVWRGGDRAGFEAPTTAECVRIPPPARPRPLFSIRKGRRSDRRP